MFLALLCASLFLSSCAGVQVTFGVGAQIGGSNGNQQQGQQQQYQQPCNGGYYVFQNPNPPRITSAGERQCPKP